MAGINVSLKEIYKASEKIEGRPLTMKQALFIKETLKTNSQSAGAKKAYNIGGKHRRGTKVTKEDEGSIASVIASENLTKPKIKETIHELADKIGLTKDFLLTSLQDDIAQKPRKRVAELSLAGKWLGLEQPATTNILNADGVVYLPPLPIQKEGEGLD